MNISEKNNKFLFHVAQIFLYLMASNLLIASTVFIFGGTVGKYMLPLSFAAAILLTGIFYGGKIGRLYILEIIVSIALFCMLAYFCGMIYDTSWDGNAYHKLAIGLLKNHWNPMNANSNKEIIKNLIQIKSKPDHFIWAEAYPKAAWIFGASIYAITENIESGKVYTILGIFCAFAFTKYYLEKIGKSKRFSISFALAAALNPIAIAQLKTFYVDGYLYLILYILVLSLIMNSNKISASLAASAMIICGNIKFTGLFYGGVFCIAYYIWYCANSFIDKEKNFFQICLKRFCLFAALGLITIFWAGAQSYGTNFINHDNLLYPLMGKNSIDIITSNSPFPEANHFKNLLISIYSRMDNFTLNHNPKKVPILKIPFAIYDSEKTHLNIIDNRISGWGVWFSGFFTLSILAILIKLYSMQKNKEFFFLSMNIFVNLLLCFVIKESWWARYSPQIYFIALIGFFIVLDAKKSALFECIFLLIILANSVFFLEPYPYILRTTPKTQAVFNAAKKLDKVFIAPNIFEGTYFNLKDAGINYIIDESLNKAKSPLPHANLNLYFHEGVGGFVLENK